MESLAPIALFVYNRPEHTLKTLNSLRENRLASKSRLYIFADGPKNDLVKEGVEQVRQIVSKIEGFLEVTIKENEHNLGLANSVISGVSSILANHDNIIVLEDDLVTSPDFLNFMNEALNFYKKKEEVFSISGYSYPLASLKKANYSAYFSHRGSSWSWGIWSDRWKSIDWDIEDRDILIKDKQLQNQFNKTCGPDMSGMLIRQLDGRIDSWAIRFAYSSFKQRKLHVLATKNKVNNIGHDNSGTHSPKTTKYNVKLVSEDVYLFPDNPIVNSKIHNELIEFHKKPFLIRLLRKFIPVKK
ncbi:hypothetical protein Pedsa_3201 [Pseudopedobacter saltans DSM 12145]|uniref:Glycosyltransferase 2-like domain-containing protein n=1 Tax=Pseudopedobacter saltans (strain ATCC 51119 / DSM 12145 / JCM 21818 / CCUG 39354 / LMG 10337 / NBRC 100064 / NCIMB 13643) TaxID=762903 RepID=F0SBB0_PSESL|nr:glycosyltransferase [Pseudopedobacter saltans]ADY53737.1 hypothetical protein Pedsa_3201 [Pseudopedobacter saltans DSM 12145]